MANMFSLTGERMNILTSAQNFLGKKENKDWTTGFQAGYFGDPCSDDATADFVDGYGRGYAAAEMSAVNGNWFKKMGGKL